MKINWVFADSFQLDPAVDIEKIKNIGATWGSWRTWRSCSTDNVICHDRSKGIELLGRAFQAVCNFYVPKKFYQDFGRPTGVKLFDGEFTFDVDHVEEIVAMHLAASSSNIVLMAGFDLSPPVSQQDRYEDHKTRNYHGSVYSIILKNPDVQWVLVDHGPELDKAYQTLPNLTCDRMENVIQLLV